MRTFPSADLGLFLPGVLAPLHNFALDHGFQVFLAGGYEVSKVYETDSDGYTEEFPEGEQRYTAIIQLESLAGLPPIDLLFHVDQISNPWKVTEKQDHSINQFAAWIGSRDIIVAYLGDEQAYGTCKPLRAGVTEERIAHVRGIAEKLGWQFITQAELDEQARQQQSNLDDLLEALA